MHIPFTASVKIVSVILPAHPIPESPSLVKVYVNHEHVDFNTVETLKPTMEFALVRDAPDVIEYTTRVTKFSSVRSITLFFPKNFGDVDTTRLSFVGFKGDVMEGRRGIVKNVVYEAKPNPEDHKVKKDWMAGYEVR